MRYVPLHITTFFLTRRPPPRSTLFPYTTLFRSNSDEFDQFGSAVALSGNGAVLAAASNGEDGGSRGIGGNQSDNSIRDSGRSEEHTSELQSLAYLVCRLLLEKKKRKKNKQHNTD